MIRRIATVAVALSAVACTRSRPAPVEARPPVIVSETIQVPRAPVPPHRHDLLDGREWGVSFHGPPFVDDHGRQTPHAHMQFMADDAKLYVGCYAADQDLRTKPRPHDPRGAVGDQFRLKIGPLALTLNPKGGYVPPGVTMRSDVDGTIDDSRDDDEEWEIELAIPWSALGPRAKEDGVLFRALRTDAPKGEPERAYVWPAKGFVRLKFASLVAKGR